jgi:hypothetical protein
MSKIRKLAVVELSNIQMSLGLGLQMRMKKKVETTQSVWRRKKKKLDQAPVEFIVILIERSSEMPSNK